MKIAFLNIHSGQVDRGAETFVKEVASRLSQKHQVSVFQTGDAKGNEKYKVEKVSLKIDRTKKDDVGTLKRRFFVDYWSIKVLVFTFKCLKDLIRGNYNIVIPVNGGWQVAIVRIITWFSGTKMVVSGQSGMGWDDLNNLWSFPNAFVALSSQALEWARKKAPFTKSFYIPNGVDLKKFSGTESIKTSLKKPVVLCVAALTKTKRIDLVIKAISKLKDVSLLIVGDGDQKENLTNLAEKFLKGRYEILQVSYVDIQKVYKSADLFTLVSESYYAFEIVITEALASGLGVVVNNDPIRKEIVEEAGLYVDNPNDSKRYAEKIKSALDVDWKEKSLTQVKKFSWDKIVKDYEDLFNELIK